MRFLLCLLLFLTACAGPRYRSPAPQTVRTAPSSEIAWNEEVSEEVGDSKQAKRAKGVIIIDPGHGGEDNGTKSLLKPIYFEKSFNLITAKFLASYLEKMGYQTLMTRYEDSFVPLKERAQFANERRACLYVSVHYNAAPSPEAQGIEIFYYKSQDNVRRMEASKKLASTILSELVKTTSAPSRGVKSGNFLVIRETAMPAVLVEGGFLTHAEELQKLKDPSYLKRVAWGIAQGIDRYLRSTAILN